MSLATEKSQAIGIRELEVRKQGGVICRVPRLEVSAGQRVAIVGENGSGKTTLLRVAAGLESEYQGQCHIAAPVIQRVHVHQAPLLFRGSVLFNVTYGLAASGVPRTDRNETGLRWLRTLGVEALAERSVKSLSGGECRRVALARALALEPELLLLDEPLADLDEQGIEVVCQAVRSLTASTVLITSPVPLPEGLTECTVRLGR